MEPMTLVMPICYAAFLWWFTTGVIIAVYKRPAWVMRLSFVGATALLLVALYGVYVTRSITTATDVYIAVTCGVVIWGWQTASYYLGFVTGPAHHEHHAGKLPDADTWGQSMIERLRLALRFTIHHELVVIGFGFVLAGITWSYSNQWSRWSYGMGGA
ncbi:MAG: DUF3623 family protein, partial [Chloroflexota bacterium]